MLKSAVIDDGSGRAFSDIFEALLVSLFFTLFGFVYETFSHEVYSGCMIYAFVFLLALGALPFHARALFGGRFPSRLSVDLYNLGIITLTIGSVMRGVLNFPHVS